MSAIFSVIFPFVLALIVMAVGGGILVLVAYGVGWVVNLVLHMDPLAVTALSLVAMMFMAWALGKWLSDLILPLGLTPASAEDDYDDEEDETTDQIILEPTLPRWRQPRKSVDFSNARPDDRCPCGSGRKYKNCHGAQPMKR